MTLRTLVISAQLLLSSPAATQWVGGFGSTFGDGGSLNLAPAYAGCEHDFVGGDTGEARDVMDGTGEVFFTPR